VPVVVVEQVVPGDVQLGGGVVVDAVVVIGAVGDTHMSAPQLETVWLLTEHEDVWLLAHTGMRLTLVVHVVIGDVQEVVLVDGVIASAVVL